MSASSTIQFYSKLPNLELAVSELLGSERSFHDVPDDWYVVITDIENSSEAVDKGMHQEVNLIATGSVIAALNIARESKADIPFFFGGDGATLLIPSPLLQRVIQALTEHQKNTLQKFGLHLRVGYVPVAEIYGKSYLLKIAKVKLGMLLSIPVLVGNGLLYAERMIKDNALAPELPPVKKKILNLEGMECRWDRILPPEDKQEVVCLLVTTPVGNNQAAIFKQVLDQIDSIYGSPAKRNPISVAKLRMEATLARIRTEMRARLGKFSIYYLIKTWLVTLYGKFIWVFDPNGKRYLRQLVELSDTLVIDGRISTVISGTVGQRLALTEALDQIEREGLIIYGMHISEASILSCYVRDRDNQHIHFVDGADGGYTLAAGMLKRKLRRAQRSEPQA